MEQVENPMVLEQYENKIDWESYYEYLAEEDDRRYEDEIFERN